MAIDTSIYGNIQPVQAPDMMDSAKNAMTLSQMALQNQQAKRTFAEQDAMRQAMAQNVNPDGSLNRQGVLSALARTSPNGLMTAQQHFAAMDKATADAQKDQADSFQKRASIYASAINSLAGMPEDQRAQVYPQVMGSLAKQGVITPDQKIPMDYDPTHFNGQFTAAMKMIGQNSQDYLGNQETKAKTAKDLAEANRAQAETPKPFTGKIDPNMDPAQLVSNYVPKDLRAKAYEEIKNAQDIKALAPKIHEAFIMGTSKNPVVAAQGQRMFEGLINTTVKDTEGTARQAAFDSIHKTMTPSGITATPGENSTKWSTIEKYLSSKASAPIAKGNGIDLTQFNSTSPYAATPQQQGGSGGLVPTAYAGDKEGQAQVQAPKYRPGDIIAVKGKMYRVGSDGDSLLPTGGGK